MCANWGYNNLHMAIRKQAMEEMHHAEWLIERIIFFDGLPDPPGLSTLKIGKSVADMINNVISEELNAVSAYNNAINLAREVNDHGSVELLAMILKMEEKHVDWIEAQQIQMKQMGVENYLATQLNCPLN